MAVDIEHGFEPQYITVRGKGKILQDIKRYGADSSEVFLAPDNDREGEAIAFHLQNVLRLKNANLPISRIVFNEITRDVIRESIRQPRELDMALVDAQKARRVLDRIVGYQISPILWEKVKKGLSAGRVQSVALALVCTREEEILNFNPVEYWTLTLHVQKDGHKKEYESDFYAFQGEKVELKVKADSDRILGHIAGKDAVVAEVVDSQRTRKPLPPYTTSKLQQEAANRLSFSSSKTMMIAQRLYEGVTIGKETTGLITYMRTDSVRVSEVALTEVRKFISETRPKQLPETPNVYATNAKAQDAHEAIRPTSVTFTPEKVKEHLSPEEYKIYSIIWERFVSSQMKPMVTSNVRVTLAVGEAQFTLTGSVVTDEGFAEVFNVLKSDSKSLHLPEFSQGETLTVAKAVPEQHFTQPPPRYTDASIVKIMEESGIGRPSTYAPTIERLIRKYYVQRTKRQLVPTQLGQAINGLMEQYFTAILDVNFTAEMEKKLDRVAESEIRWTQVLDEFWPDFHALLEHARVNMPEMKSLLAEPTEQVCPECAKMLMKRLGKFGYFLACSGFPACKYTESISLGPCVRPGCKGKIIERKTRKGREFYGCSRYPACDFISWDKPAHDKNCPKCQSLLFETGSRKNGFFLECKREDCGHKEPLSEAAGEVEAPVT
jgi:DNA topoisomerase-1